MCGMMQILEVTNHQGAGTKLTQNPSSAQIETSVSVRMPSTLIPFGPCLTGSQLSLV